MTNVRFKKGWIICPRSHNWNAVNPRLETDLSISKAILVVSLNHVTELPCDLSKVTELTENVETWMQLSSPLSLLQFGQLQDLFKYMVLSSAQVIKMFEMQMLHSCSRNIKCCSSKRHYLIKQLLRVCQIQAL